MTAHPQAVQCKALDVAKAAKEAEIASEPERRQAQRMLREAQAEVEHTWASPSNAHELFVSAHVHVQFSLYSAVNPRVDPCPPNTPTHPPTPTHHHQRGQPSNEYSDVGFRRPKCQPVLL